MTTISVQRTREGVLTSADSAHLTVTNSAGSLIVNNVLVAPTSEGTYSYDTAYLTPGNYTATWTFSVSGQPDAVLSRIFAADSPALIDTGITLMQIEQRLASRLGPYRKRIVSAGSSVSALVCNREKTSRDLGGMDELFILRRGRMTSGSLISNFVSDDRVRVVASFDHTTGTLSPDRDWTNAPLTNEEFELHAFDPEDELRPCVQWGLDRCMFWDLASLSVTGGLRQYNLTQSIPWITDPSLVYGVESSFPNSVIPANRELWWKPVQQGNAVYLRTNWVGAVSLGVIALRKHSSYVNGEMSFTGPDDDNDVLAVDMEYVLASAHVQAWINFTDKMTSLAATGLRLTAKQVSDMFTHKSGLIAKQQTEFPNIRFDNETDLGQVGNVGEAPV